jgi:hypothetical protein
MAMSKIHPRLAATKKEKTIASVAEQAVFDVSSDI